MVVSSFFKFLINTLTYTSVAVWYHSYLNSQQEINRQYLILLAGAGAAVVEGADVGVGVITF